MKEHKSDFTPLIFLASLGAGGIAVMPFVLMQYTLDHGEGLIYRSRLWSMTLDTLQSFYYLFLEAVMVVFALLHIVMTVAFLIKLFKWVMSGLHKEIYIDPVKNGILVAPIISIVMTMNVFIGPVRYFIPWMVDNFQMMFLPALIFWVILFIVLMVLEIHFLKIAFTKSFEFENLNFGWLLHPFALGMLTVVGTGIGAMSKDIMIADVAIFLSLVSGSLGIFLLFVQMIVMLKKQFISSGLPDKQVLPSFLIVVPNITLYSIAFFRMGHYLEHTKHIHADLLTYISIALGFAFEIWYMVFGVVLLFDYFKRHHFRDYYVTQWGLICPFVAFVVLGGFAYNVVFANAVLYSLLVIVLIFTIILYGELLYKHLTCISKGKEKEGLECSV